MILGAAIYGVGTLLFKFHEWQWLRGAFTKKKETDQKGDSHNEQ
ncbi:hypothetical protein SDC9_125703 [bioreactor metagenome]|uniref:Uncharacterized protein n=1 Tax=bioreactor metagenome TaxID=1076179 RepID=A0A645CPM8_9ZZZZ